MSRIMLTLPYPLSANRYWRSLPGKKGGPAVVVRSSEGKSYIDTVQWSAVAAGVRKPITGRVFVGLKLFPMLPKDWVERAAADPQAWDDDVRCIDLDNARKVLYDALCEVVIEDDRWIWKDSGERMKPDSRGARVEVLVEKLV